MRGFLRLAKAARVQKILRDSFETSDLLKFYSYKKKNKIKD